MVSLYYKALEPHMRKFRKNLNMQEMNDQLHNVNLKQELNRELNKENAILGQVSSDLQRDQINKKYVEHLGQYKESKLRRKAKDKAKIDLYKNQFNKSKEQKLIDAERERLRIKRAAKNALFDETPMAVEVISHPHGTAPSGMPHAKRGRKRGPLPSKPVKL